jgi:hypothetical protein
MDHPRSCTSGMVIFSEIAFFYGLVRTLPQVLYKASCQQGKGCSTSHLPAC